ncbi:hypothetical protein Nepgr_005690 [Nepenthes gracilis]|uniref:Glycosylphosphatidylinositol anchor attachment 1 protein n=1 Tax=Nepenthes gracilis TaxID=150966 RepID=A0AAD3S3T0_NEPGR|nr:hypothetical protein Nepgr_005690 [Nepenthes gracilis]
MEKMGEMESPKAKVRPLVRIGIFLISHRIVFSFICCIAGAVALLLLPVLAKKTYISENALMPGSANSMLSSQDVSDARKLVADIMGLNVETRNSGIEIPRILAQHIAKLGAEVSHHRFHPQPNKFHPLHFFSSPGLEIMQENTSCFLPGVSTTGIIRAPRGDGKEAIVLVTPYNAAGMDIGEALSLGMAYSVFSLLTRVTWLAKDIIWLAADSHYGEHDSVATWLREYFSPSFASLEEANGKVCPANGDLYETKDKLVFGKDAFKRAGTMAAALVIKVADGNKESEDALTIYAEASNGQMPNLDLINVVNYLAVHREGLQVKVEKMFSLIDSKFLKIVGEIIELLGKLARWLNPQWRFGIPVAEYVEGTATLASSLYSQALGIPTGSHGAFRDYQIDAVTLVISPKVSLSNNAKQSEFLLRSGRLVEGVIRSVNNLLEKFHQSFFLYFLTGPSKFVSVGVYMIAFALLIAPLPIVAASLYSEASKCDSTVKGEKPSSSPDSNMDPSMLLRPWKWLHAAKTVFIIHIWSAAVSLFPYFISQIPNITPTSSSLSWVLLSVFSLHLLYSVLGSPFSYSSSLEPHRQEWATLKSMMISAAFIGLCLMSVVNFATAEIGALLVVPLCLIAQPLKLDVRARSSKAIGRMACNLALGVVGFPPAAFFLLKGTSEGFNGLNMGEFWKWVECLWVWNSATYFYIFLVHVPCWVLFLHILLHPL